MAPSTTSNIKTAMSPTLDTSAQADTAIAYDGLMASLGRNVAIAREARGWTQAELASNAGVGRSTVAKIESFNTTDVSLSTVSGLAKALDIPPYLLFLGPDDWAKMASLASLQEMVKARGPKLGADAIDRLSTLARSASKSDQKQARDEIEGIAAGVLGISPGDSGKGDEEAQRESAAATASLTIPTALGAAMLPSFPILNAVIGGILARGKKMF